MSQQGKVPNGLNLVLGIYVVERKSQLLQLSSDPIHEPKHLSFKEKQEKIFK